MGQKTVRFSDLSGQLIMREDALARIVIHEHPELGDGPVEIEVLADEALAMEKDALRVAVLDLYLPGEDLPRRVTHGRRGVRRPGDGEVRGRDAGRRAAGQAGRPAAPRRILIAGCRLQPASFRYSAGKPASEESTSAAPAA